MEFLVLDNLSPLHNRYAFDPFPQFRRATYVLHHLSNIDFTIIHVVVWYFPYLALSFFFFRAFFFFFSLWNGCRFVLDWEK